MGELVYIMGYGILKDKTAIVTGSARGIGRGIALKFADEGANVVVNYSRSDLEANDTLQQIEKSGSKTIAVKADVSKSEGADRLIDVTLEKFGGIDILVNNAGIYAAKPLVEMSEEEWDRTMNVNLKSMFLCSKRVIPVMLKRGKGRIINIASIDALVGEPQSSCYCASKGAVMALTTQLALELGPQHITVNAIAPGIIDTPMNDYCLKNPVMKNEIIARTPARRIGLPSDIAEAALFFAKDDAEFVTGTLLRVDGGWLADAHVPYG